MMSLSISPFSHAKSPGFHALKFTLSCIVKKLLKLGKVTPGGTVNPEKIRYAWDHS